MLDQIEDDSRFEGILDDYAVLAATTEFSQRDNGAIILMRAHDGMAWTEEDRVLVAALREPLGSALAQIS